ncbi:putative indole-3-pyruvate monooxygenase [Lachnellula occidentalis]|uniref:Putative indole-3-pyruvate monooxygenase n=1 Tax=Lachnellula occidentalis TaxID=215460 RepID=A0A8H8S3Z7_9HELO|nr:putative indole-3-pyruvate monooxygenase [Lachnellula occidentalis]
MEFAAAPLPELVLHDTSTRDEIDPESIAKTWLENLQAKISQGQLEDVSDLFIDDSWWRDIVGLSWNITTKRGMSKISQYLQSQVSKSGFGKFDVIHQGVLQPRLSDLGGLIWIESGFTFETKAGTGRGILRLANTGPQQWKAWIVHTTLEELSGFPEQSPQESSTAHETKDIQGRFASANTRSGQSGLALAARLKALNVKTLTVDKALQIGDSWNNRYKSIKSHTPRYTDHYPYLDYPSDFPDFLTRNNIISWMDHYRKVMGLNVELGVTVGKIDYDNSLRHYTVEIDSQDGTKRVVTPHHVVLATGLLSDIPVRPEFENEGSFDGQIYHSSSHQSASQIPNLEGKKIVIIGSGTSAHDIAQDFVARGARAVTMIQRSPHFLISTESQDTFVLAGWKAMPTRDADLVGTSFPQAIALTLMLGGTKMMAQHDAALLSEMEKAGMAIKRGEDGIGILHHQLLKAGHFYIDQGACKMIADGRIKVKQSQEGAKGFDQKSVVLGNGTLIEADVVVLATGFYPAANLTERIMGKEFSAKIGEIASMDEEDERVACWRPSAAPGFWYMTGSFLWSRTFSRPLALQIKAIEEGLDPDHYASRE